MNPEEQRYVEDLEREYEYQKSQLRESQINQQQLGTTIFGSEQNENLVKWQLDIKEELERIEHLLRKHVPKRDTEGNEYFDEPNKEDQLFNERGVQEILNILNWYLNKNIILSNFGEEDIKVRVKQFANEFSNFIFNNYEDFGLDTKEKIKHYPLVIINVVNTVEAAYYRALEGGERDSLRTARTVTQNEPLGFSNMNIPIQNIQMRKKFNLFRPTTWGR